MKHNPRKLKWTKALRTHFKLIYHQLVTSAQAYRRARGKDICTCEDFFVVHLSSEREEMVVDSTFNFEKKRLTPTRREDAIKSFANAADA